ncbi:MAG: flippase-like domain-containing protein [Flavobacteriaceae bacterium]|nr:flippase-like domain-containing protein [Flavobacteriaceae bacterium]
MQTQHYKSKQIFFVLIKISLVVASFYFIYTKLAKNPSLDFSIFYQFLIKKNIFTLKTIIFLIFLSIFNWFFEILKWQELVSSVKIISLKKALEQSLGSLTASLFTPNRIGEYAAKAIYFTKAYRKRILLINLLSNLLQMGITCVFGITGLIFLAQLHGLNINNLYFVLVIFLIVLTSFILLTRRNDVLFKGFSFEKLKFFSKNLPKKSVVLGLLFSLLRYVIFSFQFYYLLTLFEVKISYFDAMICISSMYFLASIIPSIFVFDVVIKGSIAVYLLAFEGVDELVSLSITAIMWILNFVLPSILGSYYVLRFKFPKTVE